MSIRHFRVAAVLAAPSLIWQDTDKKGRPRQRDCREALLGLRVRQGRLPPPVRLGRGLHRHRRSPQGPAAQSWTSPTGYATDAVWFLPLFPLRSFEAPCKEASSPTRSSRSSAVRNNFRVISSFARDALANRAGVQLAMAAERHGT